MSVHCVHPLLSDQQRVLDLEVELEKVELLLWVLMITPGPGRTLSAHSVLVYLFSVCLWRPVKGITSP